MTRLKVDERRMSRALHEVAERLDVTAHDLDRLELDWRQAVDRTKPLVRQRLLATACALLVLVLAGVALFLATPRRATPVGPPSRTTSPTTSGITAADLIGLWRVDGDSNPNLWAFGTGGAMLLLRDPGDLLDPGRALTLTYTMSRTTSHTTLTATSSGLCSRSWTVTRDAVGLALDKTAGWGDCPSVFDYDRVWAYGTLTRLAPPDGREIRPKYQGGRAVDVGGPTDLTGTWLLKGSGRILAVSEAPAGGGQSTYVVTDRADELVALGDRAVDERGTVTVPRDGVATFRPQGASCDRRYLDVRTDYATLATLLDQNSCGRFGDSSDTWIRLN